MKAPGSQADNRGAGALRVVATGTLLAVAAFCSAAWAGTRFSAAGMFGGTAGPVTFAAGIILIAAACLAVPALVMLLARRRPGGSAVAGSRAARVWPVLAVLAVLAAFALLLRAPAHRRRLVQHYAPPPPRYPHLRHQAPGSPATAVIILAVLAAAAVVIAAAVIWWRRRHAPASREPESREPDAPLAAVIRAGSAAMAAVTDARQAIIACYAAMEEALAAAGSPRRAADTPDELLGRAHRAGILRTPAAARLAGLFREARFSTHTLGTAERDAAALALGDISRELGGGQ